MKKLFLPVLILLFAVSCSDDNNSAVKDNNTPVNIEFEEVVKSNFPGGGCGTESHYNKIVSTTADWNTFFTRYGNATNTPQQDHSLYTTIACVSDFLLGIGETDAFEITGVVQHNDTIKVSIHSYYNPDELKLTMSYQHYHIVKIPKTDLPFTFIYE